MLSSLKCTRIDKNILPLDLKTIQQMLKEIPDWIFKTSLLTREFIYKDFEEAMQFVNKVADLAHAEDHHPDIAISYNKVRLNLSTHKIGGLSMNDFILAAKIDLLR